MDSESVILRVNDNRCKCTIQVQLKDVWKNQRPFESDSVWPVKLLCLSTSACNTLLSYGLTGDSKAESREKLFITPLRLFIVFLCLSLFSISLPSAESPIDNLSSIIPALQLQFQV